MNYQPLTTNNIEQLLKLALDAYNQKDFTQAESLCQEVIKQEPRHAYAYFFLGCIAEENLDYTQAIYSYQQSIKYQPDYFISINNLANIYKETAQFSEAIRYYHKALELQPNNPIIQTNLGYTLLLLGDFTQGLELTQLRFNKPNFVDWKLKTPMWDGSNLEGKSIVLWNEQGLGDGIQFIRYAIEIKKNTGAKVIVRVDPPLVKLFRNCLVESLEIFAHSECDIYTYDTHASFLSLPYILKTNLNNIPNSVPYLVTKNLSSFPYLPSLSGYKIGIVWASKPDTNIYKQKSCNPQLFINLLDDIDNIVLYSLQVGEDASQINSYLDNPRVINLSTQITDFVDTACFIEQLDLIITVDTAVAHLAGAMGKPVWVLLPFVPDWRWLLNRQDSPWYPSMRLFRQPSLGDWDSVFAQVKDELKSEVRSQKSELTTNTTPYSPVTNPFQNHQQLTINHEQPTMNADQYFNLGLLNHQQQNLKEAMVNYLKCIELNPNNEIACNNLGLVYLAQQDLESALKYFQQAININPEYAPAYCNLGTIYQEQKNYTSAVASFEKAITINPNYAKAYFNLGNCYNQQELYTQAEACYLQAIKIQPDYTFPYPALGSLYQKQGNIIQAINYYKQALNLQPKNSDIYNKLGYIYYDNQDLNQAVYYYQKLVEVEPNKDYGYLNLGKSYKKLGLIQEGITNYKQALKINPNNAGAHLSLGLALMTLGNFEEGLSEYEWRLQIPIYKAQIPPIKMWEGEDLTGKNIVIWNEQGRGDAIQFVRYVEKVRELGVNITLSVRPELVPLFQECLIHKYQVVDKTTCNFGAYDYHVPLMSLPRILKLNLNNITANTPYLVVSENIPENRIILPSNNYKIGIVWATGKADLKLYRGKTISPQLFIDLLDELDNIDLYSLQVGEDATQINSYLDNPRVIDLSTQINDFKDTAYLINQLDLIITVDTAVTHLAGAMGKPVWTLLPFVADWRWFLDREDSPWYPTMRLFRQPSLGDWDSVFAQVKEELKSVGVWSPNTDSKQVARRSHSITNQPPESNLLPLHQLSTMNNEPSTINHEQLTMNNQQLQQEQENFNLALSYYQQGNLTQAIEYYHKTLAINPNCADAYNNMGVALQTQGKLTEAITAYQKALDLNPNYIDVYNNLGILYKQQQKFEEALQCYQKALILQPNSANIYYNLGNVYQEQRNYTPAIECYQKAIKLQANYASAYCNLGTCYKEQGNLTSAIEYYQKTLQLEENHPNATNNLGQIYLLQGQWLTGWLNMEQRFNKPVFQQWKPKTPMWDGNCDLKGKSIILWNEQGLGDHIQFIRYALLIKAMGANVVISTHSSLLSLFRNCLSESFEILDQDQCDIYSYDYHASLMSLPHILKTDLDSIPNFIPYFVTRNLSSFLYLPSSPNYKIGIVWGSNPKVRMYGKKSCSPQFFVNLLDDIDNIALYSLQVGEDAKQIQPYLDNPKVIDLSTQINDFVDTACLIEQLDLIITVDTAVAHLAGAMGKPVWVLLPFVPDWRWLLERDDSPWYPTMRLFRQPSLDDWDSVFAQVKEELKSGVMNVIARHEAISGVESQVTLGSKMLPLPHSSTIISQPSSINHQPSTTNIEDLLKLALNAYNQKDFTQAESLYQQVITLQPSHAYAYFCLGCLAESNKQIEPAINYYQQAIKYQPNYLEAHNNLGNIYKEKGELDQALNCYEETLKINPNSWQSYYNLGIIFGYKKQWQTSEFYYKKTLEINPNFAEAYNNLGNLYEREKNLDMAKKCYQKALAVNPNHLSSVINLALVFLLLGDFETGFYYYEKRLEKEEYWGQIPLGKISWNGENLQGKSIVIWNEQGLGDYLQFIRYVQKLQDLGAKVIVSTPSPLESLFKECLIYDIEVIGSCNVDNYNHHVSIMSLPGIFKTNLSNIEAKIPYILPPANTQQNFNLPTQDYYNIGIVWAAKKDTPMYPHKSCSLDLFINLLDELENIALYSLQVGEDATQIQPYLDNPRVIDLSSQIKDFKDTAYFINQLDLIITIDTSVAHLAGAMGKPVWVLLHYVPDWRWLLDRDDSPWYPTMRLFRQPSFANWEGVFAQVKEELKSGVMNVIARHEAISGVGSQVTLGSNLLLLQDQSSITPQPSTIIHLSNSELSARNSERTNQHYSLLPTPYSLSKSTIIPQPSTMNNDNTFVIISPATPTNNDNTEEEYFKLAKSYYQQQNFDQAIKYYKKTIEINPNRAETYNNMGVALQLDGKLNEALTAYQKAISLEPNYLNAYNNLGVLHTEQNQFEAAIACYEKVLLLHHDCADAYCNLGNLYQAQGKYTEAIQSYQKALELEPTQVNANVNLGYTLLLLGDLPRGWLKIQQRFEKPNLKPWLPPIPMWDGTNINGKSIVLWCEQGLGDSIQFIRYALQIKAMGANVTIATNPLLVSLYRQCLSASFTVLDQAQCNVYDYDHHVSLISLPSIFKTDLDTIPTPIPYLIPPNLSSSVTLPLLPDCKYKIGIVWASGKADWKLYQTKTVSPQLFINLLDDIDNIALYSLQVGEDPSQIQPYLDNPRVIDLSTQIKDFVDTAYLINQLDLIITVDTAVAHLAGAMGKPVWVLLPFVPDWRWLLDRSDSPWYPTMRLFRQPSFGDWDGVFAQVKEELNSGFRFQVSGVRFQVSTKTKNSNSRSKKQQKREKRRNTQTLRNQPVNQLSPEVEKLEVTNRTSNQLLNVSSEPLVINYQSSNNEPLTISYQSPISVEQLLKSALETYNQGKFTDSKSLYQQVIEREPNHAYAHFCLGCLASQEKNVEQAITYYQNAIKIKPDYVEVHHNLGNLYKDKGEFDLAINCYQKALEIIPNNAYTYKSLADIYEKQKNIDLAIITYEKIINLNPDDAQSYCSLSNLYKEQKKDDLAINALKNLVRLDSRNTSAYFQLAYLCQLQNKLQEAETYYLETIKLNPNNAGSYNNLGNVYKQSGKFDLALSSFNKSIEINSNINSNINPYFNRGLLNLLFGKWDEGFPEYEYRFKIGQIPEKFSPKKPIWDGSDLSQKSIVMWNEQGLGDAIQFIRYVNLFKTQKTKIIIAVQRHLVSLFQECLLVKNQDSQIEIVDREQCDFYSYDYQVPILSLPGVLKTNLHNIPAEIPYIIPPKNKREKCILPPTNSLKIGIVWGSEPRNPEYTKKSCDPKLFIDLLSLGNINLYSLQVGGDAAKIQPYIDNQRVFDLSPLITDFVDTVCLIDQLDLVITIDTSVSHLVGAMGKPVWVLLPLVPDWRWLLDRQDTPWYPNMRLFRQPKLDDWNSVFAELKNQLQLVLNGESFMFPVETIQPKSQVIKLPVIQPQKIETIPQPDGNYLSEQCKDYRTKHFEWHCQYMYENYIKHIPTRAVPRNSNYTAVIVENRCHPLLEFAIKNTLLFTPNEVGLQIFCTPANVDFVQEITKGINGVVIAVLAEFSTLDRDDYSRLLKSPYFWENISGEKILIFQYDTLLTEPLDLSWFEYPYLGAPWRKDDIIEQFFLYDSSLQKQSFEHKRYMNRRVQDPCKAGFGNGGLSIRNKQVMLDICRRYPDNSNYPEDLYFSYHVYNNAATIPNIEIAKKFCTESWFSPDSIGLHASWLYLPSDKQAHFFEKHHKNVLAYFSTNFNSSLSEPLNNNYKLLRR
jgi:tetratricopeptide (TPR) repeat protein